MSQKSSDPPGEPGVHGAPELPRRVPPVVGKPLPWLDAAEGEAGGGVEKVLSCLASSVAVALRELPGKGRSRGGLLRIVRELQARVNQLQAIQVAVVAEFDRMAGQPSNVALELSLGLSISKHTAQYQIGLAQALTTRLPNTLEAMRRGVIDSFKASRVHEPTAMLSDEQARAVDKIMATRIAGKDPTGLRRSTNLAVAKVDPDGHGQRCARRRAERRVELIPMEDGMAALSSYLPAEDAAAGYARIDTEARRRRRHDKTKTLDQHRAEVHTELLLSRAPGTATPARAEIFLYMDIYTWLGLNNHPAEMAGTGVIPAWLARHIANGPNTTLRRLITDPATGQIVSVGRDRYRPPAALSRLIHSRDRECRVPTCHRPAQRCETDHVEDWYAHTGHTADDNLAALCSRDHHTKDLPGWSYHLDKNTGTFTITTPTNNQYTSEPESLHPPRTNPLPDNADPHPNPLSDNANPHPNSLPDNTKPRPDNTKPLPDDTGPRADNTKPGPDSPDPPF